jgi:hypothetical protein
VRIELTGVAMVVATPARSRASSIRVAIVDDHRLVLDGLVARLASGEDVKRLSGVLDLVEASVRQPG